jgi:hypothetical protein
MLNKNTHVDDDQSLAGLLRYLADEYAHLSPEELGSFLSAAFYENPIVRALCRSIAREFPEKRGGKRSRSGPDKQWTSDRLDHLLIDFVFYEFCHPKKRKRGICHTIADKEPGWAGLSGDTLRKRLQGIQRLHFPFYRYLVRLLASDDPTAPGKALVMMGSNNPRLAKLLSRVSSLDSDSRRKLLEQDGHWPDHRWDYWFDALLRQSLSRLDTDTRRKLAKWAKHSPQASWEHFCNMLLPQTENS